MTVARGSHNGQLNTPENRWSGSDPGGDPRQRLQGNSEGKELFPGIVGYELRLVPGIGNAFLARRNNGFLFLAQFGDPGASPLKACMTRQIMA